jgi:two-component system sensor histidine kinase PilS (NtrC family)
VLGGAFAASEPAATAGDDGALHRKLVWLTFFRLVTVTVLLGGTALVNWQFGARAIPAVTPLYAAVAATYGASLVFSILLRLRVLERSMAAAQIVLDVAIAVVVVSATGLSESVFVFMFVLAIVNGAILLHRAGGLTALALTLVGYFGLVLVLHPTPDLLRPTLFAHGAAFVATAALASWLTEQLRRTGERLAESESDLAAVTALHESIVQSVTSGLLTVDLRGRVTFLNRAGEQITGLSLGTLLGEPADRWFPVFAREGRGEAEHVMPGGERRLLGYTVFDLNGRSGLAGTAVIFQDLTELRAMEVAVERSKRLADLGTVAAGLAHEVRNPLASISGCVELLKGAQGLSAEDQRVMGIVLRETGRLDALLSRFLEFTRPRPPERVPTDVAVVAGETLDVFAADPVAAGLRLDRALASARVPCDPDQVRQLLWNLLANAAQAIREGGKGGAVTVSCEPAPGGGAVLAVSDDGPGIPPAAAARIFTPFFTTKPSGTGLGLAVVHRIVDAHGGVIAVDSVPGQGARFTVRLPAVSPDGAGVSG